MNVIICKNGHHFDADVYSVCPLCHEKPIATVQDDDGTTGKIVAPPDIIQSRTVTGADVKSVTEKKPDEEPKIPDNANNNVRDDRTMGKIVSKDRFPTGWLVCVKGINIGKFYPVFEGWNSIARDSSKINGVQIELKGDRYVSSQNIHAKLLYEPAKREFMITLGDCQSLAYLNSSVIMSPMPLKSYDVIGFGDPKESAYMFIPLCGENFSWKDYKGE